jgi:hypothetical protein
MRRVSDEAADEVLDAALRLQGAQLRVLEVARADVDAAWADFIRGRADSSATPRRAARRVVARRTWLPVMAAGLVAATILALVWLPSRPSLRQPVDVTTGTTEPFTTKVPVTSTTSAAPTTLPGVAPTLELPKLRNGEVVASFSAVSDSEWFALSTFGPLDVEVWHTTDAGLTWANKQLPHAAGGGEIHFADSHNGLVLASSVYNASEGSSIFSTHDGGTSWAQVKGGLNVAVSAEGRTYIFADVPVGGNSRIGIESSPVGRDSFVWSGDTMGNVEWPLTPASRQLVVRGRSGWAIAYGVLAPPPSTSGSLSPPGALRLIGGKWTVWDPPCARSLKGEPEYTVIQVPRLLLGASSTGATVAVVCQETKGAPLRTFVSHDASATFEEGAHLPHGVTMTDHSWLQVLDDGTLLLGAVLGTGEPVVERSVDGGASWTVDVSFGGAGDLATMTVTPSGRILVVATVDGADGSKHTVAHMRDDRGIWVPIGQG